MGDDQQRLPFMLYDTALAMTQKSVEGAAHVARSLVGLWPARPLLAGADSAFGETDADRARHAGERAGTAASAGALSTAFGADTSASGNVAAPAAGAAAPPEERRQTGDDGRVPPAKEEGPKPFKPQVGP